MRVRHTIQPVSTGFRHRSTKPHFPTKTAKFRVPYSAQSFKIHTHCLRTTFNLANPWSKTYGIHYSVSYRFVAEKSFVKFCLPAGEIVSSILRSAKPFNAKKWVLCGWRQRWAIWHEAECGSRNCLPLQNLMRGRKAQKTTKPAFCYIACCRFVDYSNFFLIYMSSEIFFNDFIKSCLSSDFN